jgi:hypothetical protein
MGAGGLLSTAESLALFFEGIGNGVFFETAEQSEAYRKDRLRYSSRRGQLVMDTGGSNEIFDAVAFWLDLDQIAVMMFTNRAEHPVRDRLVRKILDGFPPGNSVGPDGNAD